MDLIFWRHAEAFDALEGQDDLSRTLTPKGEKQALRMGQWLDRQLPEGVLNTNLSCNRKAVWTICLSPWDGLIPKCQC